VTSHPITVVYGGDSNFQTPTRRDLDGDGQQVQQRDGSEFVDESIGVRPASERYCPEVLVLKLVSPCTPP